MENFDAPGYIKGDSGPKKSLQLQIDLEFSRYKQDCRKRALDLAHMDKAHLGTLSTGMDDHNKLILERASVYYNWLISIPDDTE